MKLVFSRNAWADYLEWQLEDGESLKRVNQVIRDTMRSPFSGIGKPEPLVGPVKGWWSRRITREHRLVYQVSGQAEGQTLEIAACRYHYR